MIGAADTHPGRIAEIDEMVDADHGAVTGEELEVDPETQVHVHRGTGVHNEEEADQGVLESLSKVQKEKEQRMLVRRETKLKEKDEAIQSYQTHTYRQKRWSFMKAC